MKTHFETEVQEYTDSFCSTNYMKISPVKSRIIRKKDRDEEAKCSVGLLCLKTDDQNKST